MKRLFLLIPFGFISLIAFSQVSPADADAEGKYTVTALSGWRVRTNGNQCSVYAPPDGEMDSWDEKLEFSLTDGDGIELEDAFTFYIQTDFPAAYENFKLISQGVEEINGLTAQWATFTFSAKGTAAGGTGSGDSTLTATLQALFYVIKKNNTLYLINGVTEKNLFSRFESPFRTIIRTFRVKE